MRLCKYRSTSGEAIGLLRDDEIVPVLLDGRQYRSLTELLEEPGDLVQTIQFLADDTRTIPLSQVTLLAPIDQQEVWAAGVTYKRSQQARMEESETAASVYDQVYDAARPELFFKATPNRVVGPEARIRIRQDSKWNVPEPELALVLNSQLRLVGFTIGNDVSSRDIEGENPLYLPQAKLYHQSCALGPCITLVDFLPPPEETGIHLLIRRGNTIAFEGRTDLTQLHRTYESLIDYLGRDQEFPHGVVLLTGTGVVPHDRFTLERKDVVEITIDGIGTLRNTVTQR
jgi:2-dehydro-3-deoxy-D-arabinonate dehydratase